MEKLEECKRLFQAAKSRKQSHEGEINEAYQFTYPSREFYTLAHGDGVPDRTKTFDATARKACRNLVTNIMNLLIPQNRMWAKITFASPDIEQLIGSTSSRTRLDDANQRLFRHFTKSNFYLATAESMYDNIIAGTAAVAIIDEIGKPLTYMPIPINELYFLEDHEQGVDAVFREHRMTARQLDQRFIKLPQQVRDAVENSPTMRFEVIESYVPGDGGFYYKCWISDCEDDLLKHGWTRWNPIVVWRWEKSLGNVWGESPIRNALPHIRAVNAMVEDMLTYGDIHGKGLYQMEDNGMVDPRKIVLEGGSIIPVPVGKQISPITQGGNFNINLSMIDSEREAIKSLLFDSSLPPAETLKYMREAAVLQLREEFYSQVGQPAQRLQREYLQPIAEQTMNRLIARGELQILDPGDVQPILKMFGGGSGGGPADQSMLFRLDADAAVAQALKIEQANRDAQSFQVLVGTVGPEIAAKHVDMDKFARSLLENLNFSSDNIRSEDDVAELEQQNEGELNAANQIQRLFAQLGGAQGQETGPVR